MFAEQAPGNLQSKWTAFVVIFFVLIALGITSAVTDYHVVLNQLEPIVSTAYMKYQLTDHAGVNFPLINIVAHPLENDCREFMKNKWCYNYMFLHNQCENISETICDVKNKKNYSIDIDVISDTNEFPMFTLSWHFAYENLSTKLNDFC